MSIVRHKGMLTATGTRCTVVFRELPDDPNTCLIIEADSLPDYFRDALDSVVSREGQSTRDLYEVLYRHNFPNGENMLQTLHELRLLQPKKTSEVTMMPTREDKIALSKLNEQLRDLDASKVQTNPNDIQKKFNPYEEEAKNLDEQDAVGIVQRLLREASDLDNEANRKREQAYKIKPELRPVEDVQEFSFDPSMVVAGDLSPEHAMRLLGELKVMYESEIEPKGQHDGFTLDLTGMSQRKATEAVKEAWKVANPDKVKSKD